MQIGKAMVRFIAIFFAVVVSKRSLLKVTGLHECSTVGTAGLSGCECQFFGACDAHGTPIAHLNIAHHLPSGLELFGHTENPSKRNIAYLCEDRTIGILYDCNSRIPLYVASVISGSQLSAADGRRPGSDFRRSKTYLHPYFQQTKNDYKYSLQREICYQRRGNGKIIDKIWYRAKNIDEPLTEDCIGGFDKLKVAMHRGHLFASQYGIGDQSKKKATFVYTNAVPQFGDFNSNPWNVCEGNLIAWGQNYCLKNGETWNRNVQIYIVVGAIPSTMFGPSETRYFGRNGFSNYQDEEYRVNVPKQMWTAACCTFEYTDDKNTWRTSTKNTAFWRDNVPGKLPCVPLFVNYLAQTLKTVVEGKFRVAPEINLFPFTDECNKESNFIPLP